MGTTLYLDCTCGISGDMTAAALLDAGASEERLRAALASLPVAGYELRVSRVHKAGLDCCDFDVVLDAAHENHDHDMTYLYGHDTAGAYAHEHMHEHAHEPGHHHDHHHDHGEYGSGHEHVDHHAFDAQRDGREAPAAAHAHEHVHSHDHAHDHDGLGHHHDHEHHHHHHEHRGPADLDAIIDAGDLTPGARALAHRMVDVLARAEAKAHGVPLSEVHFHEVGAVDSIVDIVSVAVLVDDLGAGRVIVPRLVDGHGTIRCQHGIIPVPVPATMNIVEQHGLPLAVCDTEGELVTPTGAAIVAALHAEFELPERFRVLRCGLGAGKRAYDRPSMLRALIIEELPAQSMHAPEAVAKSPQQNAASSGTPSPDAAASVSDASTLVAGAPTQVAGATTPTAAASTQVADATAPAAGASAPTIDVAHPGPVVRLECDIDDATGEVLAYAAEQLRAAGAREVHWTPIFTKKGRPAWQLQVIALPEDVERLEAVIFAETTTIGIRRWTCERTVLARTTGTAQTPWGPVRTKTVTLPDGSTRTTPEYEDVAAIARRAHVPLQTVMAAI